jgi:hypothetical protein
VLRCSSADCSNDTFPIASRPVDKNSISGREVEFPPGPEMADPDAGGRSITMPHFALSISTFLMPLVALGDHRLTMARIAADIINQLPTAAPSKSVLYGWPTDTNQVLQLSANRRLEALGPSSVAGSCEDRFVLEPDAKFADVSARFEMRRI